MRKITLFLALMVAMVTTAFAQVDYTPKNFTETVKTRTDRPMTSVMVGNESYELNDAEQSLCYVNKYDEVTFTVTPGQEVSFEANTTASWIHGAVYIDFDQNGFTAGVTEQWKPTGDLVAYSFYNNGSTSDENGWNSVGQAISGNDRNRPAIPSYTIPENVAPGEYRIRFIQDWCSIDPDGDADGRFDDFMQNGGVILDAKLVVSGGATVEPEPEPEQQSLRLLNTRPSSNDEIEGIATSWEFIFSEEAKVADGAAKELEIKNEANEVIACVGLTGVGSYENSIFTSIAPIDTIWNEYYDEYTGETIKYPSMVYPTGLNTPGIYTMTIPAGTFVSAQDNNIAIAETTLTFNVVAPKPNWWTDYDYTPTVKEFETITISFENVKEVKLNEGVAPMLYTATGAEYTGTAELVKEVDEKEGKTTYKIKVSFGEKFSEEDQYYIMIPAEMFTMDNEVSNEGKQITLEILAPVEVTPLAIESITPKFGENGEFLEVWIVYNQRVYCGNQENYWSYYVVNLTDADGNQYPMWQKDPYDPAQGWAQVIPGNTVVLIPVKTNEEGYPYEYNEYGQVLISPITTPGQYTLNLADVTVRYGYDAVAYDYSAGGYCEGTEVITIGEDTAVEGIEAEAENAEIYDLTGRRVEKITNAGIYIVNGVKKVIK